MAPTGSIYINIKYLYYEQTVLKLSQTKSVKMASEIMFLKPMFWGVKVKLFLVLMNNEGDRIWPYWIHASFWSVCILFSISLLAVVRTLKPKHDQQCLIVHSIKSLYFHLEPNLTRGFSLRKFSCFLYGFGSISCPHHLKVPWKLMISLLVNVIVSCIFFH